MKAWLDDHFEMADKTVALLIRFLEQNNGKLSTRARSKEFSALDKDEIELIENQYQNIFNQANAFWINESSNFSQITQLYAKSGKTKNRTPLLSESSVLILRSVAYGFSQSSLILLNPNHISYKVLGFFSTKVKVSNPNQK